jgi:hypothetical protein
VDRHPLFDAIAYGAVGGALAGLSGRRVGATAVATFVGTINGTLAGWYRIHDPRRPRSVAAFVLDSTWALPSTAAALVSHAVAATRSDRGARSDSMSRHRDRHVYRSGLSYRRGHALTVGNVISSAGAVDDDTSRATRRRQLIDRHEDLHVWQMRVLGPIYPLAYTTWWLGGALVGIVRWRRSREHPLGREIESAAYFANPFEWWAYSRDGNWPPRHALSHRVWRSPLCRPR